jgi:hypothetical protein
VTACPREGERYEVVTPFTATVMTHWLTAYTGGTRKTLPVGLQFMIDIDPPVAATAVGGRADSKWEVFLVDEADRRHEKYGGFSVSVMLDDIAAHCCRVA